MSAYLAAMKAASLAGYYVPEIEIEIVYLRDDDFREPGALALDFLL
jgi:hypothetical protein